MSINKKTLKKIDSSKKEEDDIINMLDDDDDDNDNDDNDDNDDSDNDTTDNNDEGEGDNDDDDNDDDDDDKEDNKEDNKINIPITDNLNELKLTDNIDSTEEEKKEEEEDKKEEEEEVKEEDIGYVGEIKNNLQDMSSDEDNDEDDDYLQKFNENVINNFLEKMHPETKQHNFNEVLGMSKIIRNSNGDIDDNNHKTIPILTKYEKTKILGIRSKQIEDGSTIFTSISSKLIDSYSIALKEFNEKKIPFIIKRPLPDGSCEYWNLKDLEII
jgi:DNA-directed RNA polymerase subunit K/omega